MQGTGNARIKTGNLAAELADFCPMAPVATAKAEIHNGVDTTEVGSTKCSGFY